MRRCPANIGVEKFGEEFVRIFDHRETNKSEGEVTYRWKGAFDRRPLPRGGRPFFPLISPISDVYGGGGDLHLPLLQYS